ncbi:MAG TPA: tripartite tricarboxylate transporter substrate binding protein, partial [Usitatibacter sp.]|nr:tripartite tricarboxylate transporter substrate binding protein [Usitatibacter sp.]
MGAMISDMKMLLALAAFAAASICNAQAPYPSRAITIVVPFTPATGADVIARLLQPKLTENLKVPVVVDNKPGASSAIGTEFVARSPADGYTLLFTATSHGTLPATKRSLPYDPVKSFTPVALAATGAMSLVLGAQVPAATMGEFIALAKKSPGALYYSSPGPGSIQNLTMELVKLDTGIDLVHVPYKGSAGAASDLVGGHVQATVASLQTMAPYVTTGRLRMVAVLSEERSPAFPNVPTMKELGHSGLVVDTWYGIFAPAGTPRDAVARLNKEVNALLQQPELRDALAKQGLTPVADRPERLGELVAQEIARWNRVVASAGLQE